MDKQTLLKEFYRVQINALTEQEQDATLLELIYNLLVNSKGGLQNDSSKV